MLLVIVPDILLCQTWNDSN